VSVARRWRIVVAAGALATACGPLRRSAPPAPTAAEREWPAAFHAVRTALAARAYQTAESTLAAFARRHAGSSEAAEASYWWAVVRLDPANRAADRSPAPPLLDAYQATDPPRAHAYEATVLRAVVAQYDSLRAAIATERAVAPPSSVAAPASRVLLVPRDSLRAREEELVRARAEAAAARAELDRVRRRLAAPRTRRP
jgi:hypothetical protein